MRFVLGFWAVVGVSTAAIMYADGVWQAGALAWLTPPPDLGCNVVRMPPVRVRSPPRGLAPCFAV